MSERWEEALGQLKRHIILAKRYGWEEGRADALRTIPAELTNIRKDIQALINPYGEPK